MQVFRKKVNYTSVSMFKNINKIALVLILVIFLASFLRLIHLGSLPAGLNNDEALAGYDAFSLLKTGKDQHSDPWPLYFKGFSDRVSNHFNIYVYLTIPSIAVFGLNEFSVRLPAAIFGILTVLVIYLLAKEVFRKKTIGLFAAFIIAISPWHVQASRLAHEAILVPFFIGLGVLLFLKGLSGRKFLMVLSSVPFAMSLYGYSTAKLLTPLVILGLLVIYRKAIWQYKKKFIIFLILLIVVASPFLYLNLRHFSLLQGRFNHTSVFSQENGSFFNGLFLFVGQYSEYITPVFLFNIDCFHIYEAVLIVLGLILVIRGRGKPNNQLLIYLFLIFPLPAALTTGRLHFLRTTAGLVILPILSGLASYQIVLFARNLNRILQRALISLAVVLVLVSLINIFLLIDNKYPQDFGGVAYRANNFKEVVNYIEQNGTEYEKIYFTDKANQPYIYLLFYLRYDPSKFQNESVERIYSPDNWQRVKSFDKFVFCDIDQCYNKNDDNLYIARPSDLPSVQARKVFYGRDDYNSFKIIDNSKHGN